MVTLSITAEAFDALDATWMRGLKPEGQPDREGGYLMIVPHATLNRLAQLRRPGESYSDVILRLAKK
jgi:hypothetical protein